MVSIETLRQMKTRGEKIAMLTCYEASFAQLMNRAGVDVLLVGDSLAMTVQGNDSTLSVSLSEMVYHTRVVAKGNQNALIVSDLPFGSYQANAEQAFHSAVELMRAGAHMVKLEGGAWIAPTTEFLQQRGIPVCAHIGLTPQSVHTLGGYRVQGQSQDDAKKLYQDALAHTQAGAALILMECVPANLAREITEALSVPTIGIGAGKDCDGQVLVMHDMLGIYPKKVAKFVKNFMEVPKSIEEAIHTYVQEVKKGIFPEDKHSF